MLLRLGDISLVRLSATHALFRSSSASGPASRQLLCARRLCRPCRRYGEEQAGAVPGARRGGLPWLELPLE
eukprot:7861652-Pyramimonas_sp.AAC.1